MSATSQEHAIVQQELDGLTTCCICDETYKDPTILPCVHTFCLTCLQHTGTHNDKKPGDLMPCPVCRQQFTIPSNGFSALKRNFFMVKLIEVATAKQEVSNASEKHKHEKLCVYCRECNEVLCSACLHDGHQNHQLLNLNKAVEMLHSDLEWALSAAKHCISNVMERQERLCEKKFTLSEKIEGFEREVYKVKRDLKVLIDQHADSLLQNLDSLKKERVEDIEIEEKELQKHLDCLKNFEICCSELASTDQHDNQFYKTANETREQMFVLEQINDSIVERQLRSFKIRFMQAMPTASEVYKAKNIIGEFEVNVDPSEQSKLVQIIETKNTEGAQCNVINGMAVSSNEVFIVYETSPVVSIYDRHTRKCKNEINLNGFFDVVDLKHCVCIEGYIFIVNGSTREILRIDANRDFLKWSTGDDWGRLSVSAESTLVATCYDTNALREYSLQGIRLHETKLCSMIVHPQHAIKLDNGHFIVSHGNSRDALNQVSMVNSVGVITKSFARWSDSKKYLLEVPTCLDVDKDGNILVIDSTNRRILLLSPELDFKRVLLTNANGLRRPVAMHLDKKASRLLIANNNFKHAKCSDSRVLIFAIK